MQFVRPLRATKHCRHYSYEPGISGGPRCAVDCDVTGAVLKCLPEPKPEHSCMARAEYTDAERSTWREWIDQMMARMAQIMPLIPGSSRDRTNRPEWGKSGSFACPACKAGTVSWARARVNGHVHAGCSTPNCFEIIE